MTRAMTSSWWIVPCCLVAMGCGPEGGPGSDLTRQISRAPAKGAAPGGQGGGASVGGSDVHTSSGRVAGAAGAGVTLALSGGTNALALTDLEGKFRFEDLPDGTYSLTPQKDGYRFQPFFVSFSVNGANVTEQNFLSWPDPIAHGIFGTIEGDRGLDVTLTLDGPLDAVKTTGGQTDFGFTGLPDGRYQLTPSLPGWTFEPESLEVIVNGADVNGVTLTAKRN